MKHRIEKHRPEAKSALADIKAEFEAQQRLESFSSGGAEWDRAWNRAAEGNAKFGVFVWVVYGIFSIFFAHQLQGNFISLFIFLSLYFFVATALAAGSCIVPCLPMYLLNKLYHKYPNPLFGLLATIATMFTWVFVIIWIIFVSNFFISFLNSFIH